MTFVSGVIKNLKYLTLNNYQKMFNFCQNKTDKKEIEFGEKDIITNFDGNNSSSFMCAINW